MWLSRDEFTGNNICKIWHNKPSFIDGSYYIKSEESGLPDEAEYWDDIKGSNRNRSGYINVGVGALMMLRPDLDLKRGDLLELNSEQPARQSGGENNAVSR